MAKFLLTVAVIYAIWFYFKNQRRIKAAHDEVMAKKAKAAAKSSAPVAQDMTPCPKCGAYIAAGAPHTCESAS